jgi:hypothetical protein
VVAMEKEDDSGLVVALLPAIGRVRYPRRAMPVVEVTAAVGVGAASRGEEAAGVRPQGSTLWRCWRGCDGEEAGGRHGGEEREWEANTTLIFKNYI